MTTSSKLNVAVAWAAALIGTAVLGATALTDAFVPATGGNVHLAGRAALQMQRRPRVRAALTGEDIEP